MPDVRTPAGSVTANMEYEMKVKDLDEGTDYPIDVLAGMTGLGMDTIRKLEREGTFKFVRDRDGAEAVNGKQFLDWARSVNNRIEVETSGSPR